MLCINLFSCFIVFVDDGVIVFSFYSLKLVYFSRLSSQLAGEEQRNVRYWYLVFFCKGLGNRSN